MTWLSLGALLSYSIFTLLVFTFLYCLYTLKSRRFNLVEGIDRMCLWIFFLFLLEILFLGFLLTKGDFEYKLVYETTNIYMPIHQKLSALWANQNSSLNFWCFLMTCAVMVCSRIGKKYQNEQSRIITTTIFLFTIIVFFTPVVFVLNPFEKLWVSTNGVVESSLFIPRDGLPLSPGNGVGLNPSLRHVSMIFHPLFLYLGMIGFFIPYTQAMASLILRDKEHKWILNNRRVSLFAWVCLTIGILIGSWWAYSISGWGGYWSWDAVEIAGLIPWLISIAYIHALNSTNRKTGSYFWVYCSISLIIIFILMGIFVTRSGVIESVHAYAKGPIGPILSLLVGIFTAFSFYLIFSRKGFLRRETSKTPKNLFMVISHCLLLLLAAFYFFGQTLPITSSLISGERRALLMDTYEWISTPIILAILFLEIVFSMKYGLGEITRSPFLRIIAPLLLALGLTVIFDHQYGLTVLQGITFFTNLLLICILLFSLGLLFLKPASSEAGNADNGHIPFKRQWKNLIIHLGFCVMLLGILGVEFGADHTEAQLEVGESMQVGSLEFKMNSAQSYYQSENRAIYESSFIVDRNGSFIDVLAPRITVYGNLDIKTTQPAIHSSFIEDIQIVLRTWKDASNKTVIDILNYPLAIWIWIGGGMMVLGGIMVMRKE